MIDKDEQVEVENRNYGVNVIDPNEFGPKEFRWMTQNREQRVNNLRFQV